METPHRERSTPPTPATTVRVRDGQRQVQDGPFPDSKEQLGGFFLIEVPDLDAAIAFGRAIELTTDPAVATFLRRQSMAR